MKKGDWLWGTYQSDSESGPTINVEGFILDTDAMFDEDEDKYYDWIRKNFRSITKQSSWCDPLTHYNGKCQVRRSEVEREFKKRIADAEVESKDVYVDCPECSDRLMVGTCGTCFGVGCIRQPVEKQNGP